MKILRTKVWHWYDIGLLKWSVLLFGMVAGAYVADLVKGHIAWFLLGAILFEIRPVIAYFKE